MTDPIPQFLTVDAAAKLLATTTDTITAAIESGKLPAIRLSETHRGTRINRDDLIPVNERAADLRTRRLRKLALEARADLERVQVKQAELADAIEQASRSSRALETELALDELDQAADRRHVA